MSVYLVRLGRLREKLASLATMLRVAFGTRSVYPLVMRPENEATIALPYSVPLAMGTVIAVGLMRGIG